MYRTGEAPADVVEALGLAQVSDTDELRRIVDEVHRRQPEAGRRTTRAARPAPPVGSSARS